MPRSNTVRSIIKGEMTEIWELFSAQDREEIIKYFKVVSLKKGSVIYTEGEVPTDLVCLIRGKVKITKEGVGGRSQIIRLICPMQYFGYQSFFAGIPQIGSAVVLESAVAAFLPLNILEKYILKNSKLAYFFVKATTIDLMHSDNKIVSLTQKHIRGRLAEALFTLRDFFGTTSDKYINAHLLREDIANLSNMTTSNAIRTLSAFAKEGLIELKGRNIKIIDEIKLSKISKFGW